MDTGLPILPQKTRGLMETTFHQPLSCHEPTREDIAEQQIIESNAAGLFLFVGTRELVAENFKEFVAGRPINIIITAFSSALI